jgi:GNAT superfamily N-acetyltransferase
MKNFLNWSRIGRTIAKVPLASGYRFELLQDHDIAVIPAAVKAWFPEISVGSASSYLREDFFRDYVYLPGGPEKDVLVVLIRKEAELAGLFSCERDLNTLSLYAKLGVVAPRHRGMGLSHAILLLAEAIGRDVGMEMMYGMATLRVPHVQRAFETLGWQLIGITPGYDREMVAPGVVKRVYEAVYAKVLVAENGLLRPRARNLTQRTRAFFRMLFPRKRVQQT